MSKHIGILDLSNPEISDPDFQAQAAKAALGVVRFEVAEQKRRERLLSLAGLQFGPRVLVDQSEMNILSNSRNSNSDEVLAVLNKFNLASRQISLLFWFVLMKHRKTNLFILVPMTLVLFSKIGRIL